MAREELSIDQLLANQQQQEALRATIEAIPDDSERVKVTPFYAGLGCVCALALKVARNGIEAVTTTGDVHICCGKRLMVVEISFNDGTLNDLFEQLSDPARLGVISGSARDASANRSPLSFSSLMEPPLRGQRAFISSSNLPAGNQPLWSHERGVQGGATASLLERLLCDRFHSNCISRCHELQGLFGLDDSAFYSCVCHCDNDYARCLDPRAPQLFCP